MKIINYLFIFVAILGVFSCGKNGSLFLPNNENVKWIEENDPNKK